MEEKELASKIGKRLKALRQSLDITQIDFANDLERTQKEVSSWENGKKLIPLLIIFKVREKYNIPFTYFDPEDDSSIKDVFTNILSYS